MSRRVVQLEILDTLPHGHPEAVRSRQDIRLLNRLMGNSHAVRRRLVPLLRETDRILEIGAGDGDLIGELQEFKVDGLDLCPAPEGWPSGRVWHQQDLMAFTGYGDYTVILANLILHQFEDGQLRDWAKRLPEGIRILYANEPRRSRLHLWQLKFAPLLRLNRVTRHDARVSIQGGFRGEELGGILGMSPADWQITYERGFHGRYSMLAVRR